MKKAVGYLIPYMEKEKEESMLKMKEEGTWNENVNLIINFICYFCLILFSFVAGLRKHIMVLF